ncbi:MAG: isopeptide-forming domain-containing fimbrial protein [Oscillospiraceae bacterium]|nr:isopeptide-forming domain-containing fimbrial protein [Oscillospiraceae bacterium]
MKKQWKRLLALLMVLTMCVAVLPGAVLAADDEESGDDSSATTVTSKTLTVDASATEVEGETYNTIQAAINYINTQDDKTDWTITVESGAYKRFTVLTGLDGLTIQAADNANVTISTWDGTESENGSVPKKQESYYLYNGIYIMSQGVTLKGLTVNVGWDVDVSYATTLREGLSDFDLPYSSCWYVAGIRTTKADSADGLVIDSCHFTSSIQGDDSNTNYGILTACYTFTVKNTTFDGFWQGISVMGDYYAVDSVSITGNTFTDCNRAISIYYKVAPTDTSNMGTLSITNNVIVGSSDVRSKIILHDVSSNGSMGNVIMSGNTFIYGFVLIVNFAESPDTINGKTVLSGEAKSAVFADNTWSYGSFYVESSEYYNSDSGYIGTLEADIPELAYYEAPEDDTGYWVLNTDLESGNYTGSYANPEGTTEYVQSVIKAANEAGSHTLSFTFDDEDQLIYTLTAFKDAIYWVSSSSEKTSEPGLEKKILLEDGTEVDQTSASTNGEITFQLTSNVPKGLDTYDEYTLTFHDVLDSALSLNEDSFIVKIGDIVLEDTNYTLTISTEDDPLEDGCTFELSIVLTDIEGIEEYDEIVVTYTAVLKTTTPGAYYNEAWVTYPDDESEHDKVEVDTYGISVFKYDASEYTTGDDGTITYKALSGAEFTLYSDEALETVIGTYTSGNDGYLTFSGLAEGTYYLVETQAPSGYVGSSTVIEIVIPDDANADTFWAYANVPNAPVPSTGGTGTAMYTTVGVIILLAAGCVFLFSRKKRESE